MFEEVGKVDALGVLHGLRVQTIVAVAKLKHGMILEAPLSTALALTWIICPDELRTVVSYMTDRSSRDLTRRRCM